MTATHLFYIYHKDYPGNPWGPFLTIEQAEATRQQLVKDWGHNPYLIREEINER